MPTVLGSAVETDLPHVSNIGENPRKERQLACLVMRNLRVEAQSRANLRNAVSECRSATPRGRRRSDRENVKAPVDAVAYGRARVIVEIEMCVKVDHLTP